jgi:hypothetical protein
VEWFDREFYPDLGEIERRAKEIPGLWQKLQIKITSEDIPRIISTWPWPIVNEIAVEMMTKTTFDIVNFALEKTRPDFISSEHAVLIAGGDAFKASRNKNTDEPSANTTGEGDRERFAAMKTTTRVKSTIIPDRGAGFIQFFTEKRTSRKRVAISVDNGRNSTHHKYNPKSQPARFAQFHHPTSLENKNIVPGEIKVCFKFQLEDITAVTAKNKLHKARVGQAEKVFSQIYRYMNENESLWGYLLTDYEVIVIRRTTEFGRLKVSQSIPLSAKFGNLNAKIVLWWLHYGVAYHVPTSERDMGGYLPRSPIPRNIQEAVNSERIERENRKFYVEKAAEGYDILIIRDLEGLRLNDSTPRLNLSEKLAQTDTESRVSKHATTSESPGSSKSEVTNPTSVASRSSARKRPLLVSEGESDEEIEYSEDNSSEDNSSEDNSLEDNSSEDEARTSRKQTSRGKLPGPKQGRIVRTEDQGLR